MVEEEDHKLAAGVSKALKTLSFQLSGAQLGITLTSLVVGFIVKSTLGKALEPVVEVLGVPGATVAISVTVALLVVTSAEMVIGELVPKNVAIAKPLEASFKVATPLRFVNALFKPLIVFLNGAANLTVRLLGIEPRDELSSISSLEELQVLIRSSREQGTLHEEEFSLLARSITFGQKTAAEALIPRTSILAMQKEETLADLAKLAIDSGHSRFPVYGKDLDDIVGIAHVKDCYRVQPNQRRDTPVSRFMRDMFVTPESRQLRDIMVEMRRGRIQMAVVVDEYGGTAGILTLEDMLEEIVGEIEDEYDPRERVEVTSAPEGIHVLGGMLHPDEVADACGFTMPEGDYDTLAGFLLTLFDRIPSKGEHVSYEGWEFKVVEMDRLRISKVLVVAPVGPETPEGEGSP